MIIIKKCMVIIELIIEVEQYFKLIFGEKLV